MKLLLHSCCGPCSLSCVKSLRAENIEPYLFWYNPNIHPKTEYKARLNCLSEYTQEENLNLTIINEDIKREDFNIENKKNCEKCYRVRLEKAASFAANESYCAFSTTLLISPYQDHELIKTISEELAAKYSVDFFYKDFRPLFREGQAASRAKGMYMQKYCGCML